MDISLVLEKEVNGTRVPLPCVIRMANKKPLAEIYTEIVFAKSQVIENEGDFVFGEEAGKSGSVVTTEL